MVLMCRRIYTQSQHFYYMGKSPLKSKDKQSLWKWEESPDLKIRVPDNLSHILNIFTSININFYLYIKLCRVITFAPFITDVHQFFFF